MAVCEGPVEMLNYVHRELDGGVVETAAVSMTLTRMATVKKIAMIITMTTTILTMVFPKAKAKNESENQRNQRQSLQAGHLLAQGLSCQSFNAAAKQLVRLIDFVAVRTKNARAFSGFVQNTFCADRSDASLHAWIDEVKLLLNDSLNALARFCKVSLKIGKRFASAMCSIIDVLLAIKGLFVAQVQTIASGS